MPGAQYIALSGMRTRLDELDRLANDIANVGTAGYKSERGSNLTADRPAFTDVLQSAIDVTAGGRRLDVRSGAIDPTGRDLDIAIEGDGFFTVQTAAGVRYTRNGHFSRSAEGFLTTPDGSKVLGTNGPLQLGSGKTRVDEDGTVMSGDAAAGRLAIVRFADAGSLVRESGSILRADGLPPTPASQATVRVGSLEQSNVSVVERVAELTNATRSFEALQKSVSILMNDVEVRAIEVLGRR
ncbi:MAG TPA: flagellar hook basal-body protein [Vicinamibacterales bacterium]|jgi:flagellar basal body rod protein FlgG|nr:flagellar hook basal-body protein [Vicinamibacterales bacterium]